MQTTRDAKHADESFFSAEEERRPGWRGFIVMKGCEEESEPNERPSRDQSLASVIRWIRIKACVYHNRPGHTCSSPFYSKQAGVR